MTDWTQQIREKALEIPRSAEEGDRHDAFVRFETQYDALENEAGPGQQWVVARALGEIVEQEGDAHIVAECVYLAAKRKLGQLKPIIEQLEESERFTDDPQAWERLMHAVSTFSSFEALPNRKRS